MLDQILARETAMRVCTAEDGMAVEPNRVYVAPPAPGTDPGPRPAAPGGTIHSHRSSPHRHLFRSLAALGEQAIAVVLSGAGADGSEGIKAVKAAGGTVLAQDAAERRLSRHAAKRHRHRRGRPGPAGG